MQDNFECLSDIEELEATIAGKKTMFRFKTIGIRRKNKKITKEEQLNRRLYRELFQYRIRNNY